MLTGKNKIEDAYKNTNANIFKDNVDDLIYSSRDYKESDVLLDYFIDNNSKGGYVIAETYIDKVVKEPFDNGRIEHSEEYKKKLENKRVFKRGNEEYRVNGRLYKSMKNINEEANKTIIDDNYIYIDDASNLTPLEKNSILQSTTSNTNQNSFVAEIVAHAEYVRDWKSKIPLIGKRYWYNSAIIANMGVGEENESGIWDDYFDINSSRVKKQRIIHGDK